MVILIAIKITYYFNVLGASNVMTFRHRRYPVMNDDTKSILLDSVYAPLELPNYSLHTALVRRFFELFKKLGQELYVIAELFDGEL